MGRNLKELVETEGSMWDSFLKNLKAGVRESGGQASQLCVSGALGSCFRQPGLWHCCQHWLYVVDVLGEGPESHTFTAVTHLQ